jgi:hypothetical protein
MTSSNARTFLQYTLLSLINSNRLPARWEFSAHDGWLLFDFIHPSVNTRAPEFTLFNLPVKWDAGESALVDSTNGRTPISVERCLAGDDLQRETGSGRLSLLDKAL